MTSPARSAELLLPVAKVAERLTGNRPSPATLWRWLRKGCHGVKLNAVMLGGKWLCTESDFRRFMDEQTTAMLGDDDDADLDARLAEEGLI